MQAVKTTWSITLHYYGFKNFKLGVPASLIRSIGSSIMPFYGSGQRLKVAPISGFCVSFLYYSINPEITRAILIPICWNQQGYPLWMSN
jgi:hypothetical protein